MATSAVRVVPPRMARPSAVRARSGVDAAQSALRSRLVLSRRAAGDREVAQGLGVPPMQVGQAALLGQMTTGFPVSPLTPATFLVVGLCGIDLGEHQRFTAPCLFAASVMMTIACVLFGVFSAVKTIRIGVRRRLLGRPDRAGGRARREQGALDYLVFECLAERTIALAQQAKASDPDAGYRPAACRADGGRAARVPPPRRAHRHEHGRRQPGRGRGGGARGRARARPARAEGGDRHGRRRAGRGADGARSRAETGEPVRALGDALVSANAYLGAEPIVEALAAGRRRRDHRARGGSVAVRRAARSRIRMGRSTTGRCSGAGTLVGHLLECAGQVTGGYFADPGVKDVAASLAWAFRSPKWPPTGGGDHQGAQAPAARDARDVQGATALRDSRPRAYVTPDVVADFSRVRFAPMGRTGFVSTAPLGARGRARSRLQSAIVMATSARGRFPTRARARSRGRRSRGRS